MSVKQTFPLQWTSAVIQNFKAIEARFESNALVRYTVISAALISQIIGLLVVCFLGILIGSFAISLLR